MKVKVTENGVTVPRELLDDAEEVEIRKENGKVIVTPLPKVAPILGLGENPVACGAPDASEQLDRYLYTSAE